ncbi:MAG TPA: TRAP transporter small permease [Balneolaceae bacterium]|nr:TRAP transporter small permease [Balneolaceae bacterium]|tara:strand:- start:70221 stop:70703 length:483 start_codon:yes stop_codon:yes gene_type:complete
MKFLEKTLEYVLASLMGIMLITVCWQVISRYILAEPSSFTDELARFLLIWIGMLGSAYASGQHMHLAIDLLPSKLEGTKKFWLNMVIYSMVILFVTATFVIGGSRLVYMTTKLAQTSAAMQMPLAYVYSILPISGVIILIYCVRDIFTEINTPAISNQES